MAVKRAYLYALIVAGIMAMSAGCGKQNRKPESAGGAAAGQAADSNAIPRTLTDSSLVRLAFRFHQGEMFHYKIVSKTISHGTFNKFPSSADMEITCYFTLRIASVNGDSMFTVVMKYDSVLYSMQDDQNTTRYDSNDSTLRRDAKYAQWNALIGEPVPVTISSTGEILHVDSLGAIADRILSQHQLNVADTVPPGMRDQIMEQVSETAIKAFLGHVFMPLPEKKVGRDSTWSRYFTGAIDNIFPTENTLTYTLAGFSPENAQPTAHITSALYVKILKKEAEDNTAAVALHSGSVTGSGTTDIDVYSGIVRSKDSRIVISEKVSSIGKGKFAGGKGDIAKHITLETILQRL